jgi:lipid-binding SYLF domain-containing protein
MKALRILVAAILLSLTSAWAVAAGVADYSPTIQVFRQSPVAQPFFKNAYGYAVFPKIGKGAAGVGGAFGKGQVYRGGKVTGLTSLFQLSVGLQLGGEAFSEIIFFQDQRAYDDFTRGNFEFDATASAVAITAAAQTQTGTTGNTVGASVGPKDGKQIAAKYVKGMAVLVHTKGGLMYEVSVGGQKFSFEPIK